jgi:hypothetical protein
VGQDKRKENAGEEVINEPKTIDELEWKFARDICGIGVVKLPELRKLPADTVRKCRNRTLLDVDKIGDLEYFQCGYAVACREM